MVGAIGSTTFVVDPIGVLGNKKGPRYLRGSKRTLSSACRPVCCVFGTGRSLGVGRAFGKAIFDCQYLLGCEEK
ncbi:MAG: hypothetical protein Q8Q06_02735 [bacterium]|nr:hypothetical protein [bacterium]